MESLHGLDGLKRLPAKAVVSIGNFDGVHRGHQRILEVARGRRAALSGSALAVVTFEPHPFTVLRPEMAPPRLTGRRLKEELLRAAGVNYLVVLPPDHSVLDLTAEQFWHILHEGIRAACLVEGRDFSFGKGRGGTIDRLREWAAGTDVEVEVVEPVRVPLLDLSVVNVSSSLIRWLVSNGRVRDAAICLGRPYTLEGPVVEGRKRGRTIGVPTANVDCSEQLIPLDGVYAGRCEIGGRAYPAALSIGTMPTFNDTIRQVEAHLIGFDGNLYGATIRVEVLDWIREQRKFDGVDALKRQMQKDMAETVEKCGFDPAVPIAELSCP